MYVLPTFQLIIERQLFLHIEQHAHKSTSKQTNVNCSLAETNRNSLTRKGSLKNRKLSTHLKCQADRDKRNHHRCRSKFLRSGRVANCNVWAAQSDTTHLANTGSRDSIAHIARTIITDSVSRTKLG